MFQYLEMSPICNKHTPLSSAYSPQEPLFLTIKPSHAPLPRLQ